MGHGYGMWTFAWIEAERAQRSAARAVARAERFNERWQRLNRIYEHVCKNFVTPLEPVKDRMTPRESGRLNGNVIAMGVWFMNITNNINAAGQTHLSHYATAIKSTALKAMGLCKKYGVHKDITNHKYDVRRKMVTLNGRDLYYLGS